MGWASDWLYGLIFAKVRRLWDTAVKDGKGQSGPAPDYLVVSQYADVSSTPSELRTATLLGPIVRTWRFDDAGPRLQAAPPAPTREPTTVRGMFHEVGRVTFAISADRKRVAFTFVVGPRYWRHWTFAVKGQGKRASLEPHPDFSILLS